MEVIINANDDTIEFNGIKFEKVTNIYQLKAIIAELLDSIEIVVVETISESINVKLTYIDEDTITTVGEW